MVKGVRKRITFCGSEGDMNGIYTTRDLDIQKAIETSPGYGKAYKLHKVFGDDGVQKTGMIGPGNLVPGMVTAEVLSKNKIIVESKSIAEVIDGVVDPTGKIQKVFRSVNEAQELLTKAPYNIPKTRIRTTAEVIAQGELLGLEIIFNRD